MYNSKGNRRNMSFVHIIYLATNNCGWKCSYKLLAEEVYVYTLLTSKNISLNHYQYIPCMGNQVVCMFDVCKRCV